MLIYFKDQHRFYSEVSVGTKQDPWVLTFLEEFIDGRVQLKK
jgi:hypothetical protein